MSLTILYLYSEVGPYNIPIFKELSGSYQAQVHVVQWDHRQLKPYEPPALANVTYYPRSLFPLDKLHALAEHLRPQLVYISGWMDPDYVRVAKRLRRNGVPVVTGFDDMWVGSFRQRVGKIIFPFVLSGAFSHAWVAGPRQYEFARQLGFKDREIIFEMLSCDHDLFTQAWERRQQDTQTKRNSFLYVGNFRRVKGTDVLIKAFRHYRDALHGSWKLICAGNGEMRGLLDEQDGVDLHGFTQQDALIDLAVSAGAFILPSRHDQWGVVVHEFAAAGLPLLLSEHVGARNTFLIEGHNGFCYADDSPESLAAIMKRMETLPRERLAAMGSASRQLSLRITPKSATANLMSIIGGST